MRCGIPALIKLSQNCNPCIDCRYTLLSGDITYVSKNLERAQMFSKPYALPPLHVLSSLGVEYAYGVNSMQTEAWTLARS